MTDITVHYIHGFPKDEFDVLNELGFEITIPEDKPVITALAGKPEDYLIIFGIYFSIKVIEKLVENSADGLSKKILKVVSKLWTKHNKTKPALVEGSKNPVFKEPKAVITFQISDDETSKFEITNDINEKQLEVSLETFLKLVKLQYKNRKEEAKFKKLN